MGELVTRGDISYELGPGLGQGTFGACYKAMERGGQRTSYQQRVVAVKKVSQEAIKAADREAYLRYEIALHSQLVHSNVVELFVTFSSADSIYMVLEYCSNKSLADLVARTTALQTDQAAYYFQQLMRGLAYIHEHQIVHRDLTLSNILVAANDVVKISSFSLACSTTRAYLERHLVCGTASYLSPEALLRAGHTAKSDMWSCGVLLYAMFGGITPFQTDAWAGTYRCIVSGSYHFTQYHCDDQLKDLIAQLLRLEPDKRPSPGEAQRHGFVRYSEQYKLQLSMDAKAESSGCGLGWTQETGKSSRALLSRSLTSLFGHRATNGAANADCCSRQVQRSLTSTVVIDMRVARTAALLEHFHSQPVWTQRATDFHTAWLTWWRDKTATAGLYYQLSTGYNCALYNDATCCMYNNSSTAAYFANIHSRGRRLHSAMGKFYEPLLQDLLEEFQDVPATNKLGEQISWVTSRGRFACTNDQPVSSFLTTWSVHCGGTCRVFYLSDGSIQVNFGAAFLLKICGPLCYFYQPAKKSFLVETKPFDAWCCQEVNAQLVDALSDIFL